MSSIEYGDLVWEYPQHEGQGTAPGAITLVTSLKNMGTQKPANFYEQLIYGDSSSSSSSSSSDSGNEAVLSSDKDMADD